jgi:hypothetical protein
MAMIPNKKGTGFTNVNKLMQANQQNRLGQAVAGNVQQQAQGAKNALQSSQEDFQQQTAQNQADSEQNKQFRQGILGRFAEPVQDTTQPIVTQEETKKFQQLGSGAYAGPSELRDQQAVLGKAQQAEQTGQLTTTQGGRQELLKQTVGTPKYTPGQQRLDSTLLGQQGNNQLRGARRSTVGLTQQVNQAGNLAQQQAQEQKGRATAFGQETKQQVQSTAQPISQSVDTAVQQAQDAENARQEQFGTLQSILRGEGNYQYLSPEERAGIALTQGLQSGSLSEEDANLLSQNLPKARTLGVDISKELLNSLQSFGAEGLNRAGVVSDADRAKLNALDTLYGKQASEMEFGSDPFQKYKAGYQRYNVGTLDKNLSRLQAEKDQRDWDEANYYNNLTPTQKAYYGVNQNINGMLQYPQNILNQGSLLDAAAAAVPTSDILTGRNNFNQTVDGLSQQGQGSARAAYYGNQALLQQLLTEGLGLGENNEIVKATNVGNSAFEKGLDLTQGYTQGVGNTIQNLRDGDILQVAKNLSGIKQQEEVARKVADAAAKGLDVIKDAYGNVVGTVAKNVGNAVGSIFCFEKDTPVLMADGTYKKVKNLKLDDMVALGGKITAIGQARNNDLHDYNGVFVSGGHALLDEQKGWVRVKDCQEAVPVGKSGIVYPIETERHILVTEGQIWSDVSEVDNYTDMNDDEILAELNSEKEKNSLLLAFAKRYFNDKKK